MPSVTGLVELTVTLNKSTCCFLRTGKCSLHRVQDYFLSPVLRTSQADTLYCPRLHRAMTGREPVKPITITPCGCGHAEVVSGKQRACIAAQQRLTVPIRRSKQPEKALCAVCDGQLTFDSKPGAPRIITVRAQIELE